jgi:hypothetical protein
VVPDLSGRSKIYRDEDDQGYLNERNGFWLRLLWDEQSQLKEIMALTAVCGMSCNSVLIIHRIIINLNSAESVAWRVAD